MATSEELPRTLSRWTEKAFKNILALDKKDLPLVRNKAAAIYLDEDNDLVGDRDGGELPQNFTSNVGKKYLEACAKRLEEMLKEDGNDYRSKSSASKDHIDLGFKALIQTGVKKSKPNPPSAAPTPQKKGKESDGKSNAGKQHESEEEEEESEDEPSAVSPPAPSKSGVASKTSSAKTTVSKPSTSSKTSGTASKTLVKTAPASKPVKTVKPLKPTTTTKQAPVENESQGDESERDESEREASPVPPDSSVADEAPETGTSAPAASAKPALAPESTIPAKRKHDRVDTPLDNTEQSMAMLPRALNFHPELVRGVPPNKIQRLCSAVMSAQTACGTSTTHQLISCADVGTRYVPPEAIDTLTETLFTIANAWKKAHDAPAKEKSEPKVDEQAVESETPSDEPAPVLSTTANDETVEESAGDMVDAESASQ